MPQDNGLRVLFCRARISIGCVLTLGFCFAKYSAFKNLAIKSQVDEHFTFLFNTLKNIFLGIFLKQSLLSPSINQEWLKLFSSLKDNRFDAV